MNRAKRDFKGVWIPKEIYLNEELNWTEKILLVEIDSLDNEKGCFAKNKHFAEFLGKSENYISKCISKLRDMGFIRAESFDGRHRLLRSNLKYTTRNYAGLENNPMQGNQIVKGRVTQKSKGGKSNNAEIPTSSREKSPANNTSNNTVNNTNKYIRKYEDEIGKIISYWQENLADINNPQGTKKQKKLIATKLNKWDCQDIIKAIQNYREIYDSDYYYSHNWTLTKFIKQSNGIPRFQPGLEDNHDGDIWKDYQKWVEKRQVRQTPESKKKEISEMAGY